MANRTGSLGFFIIDRIFIWHNFFYLIFKFIPDRHRGFFYKVSYKNSSSACPIYWLMV